ncbi:hypothetical protein RISK_001012 [Rhodopirellula islandica]|uniref:Uncharacterized protein n=1 Tax=Rhodopirellula islandica TaxID=595434 RepID=A0A0J1BL02_RHOIS|nr:hypothetical protein RISK_001012 [Rhodopirellula islandica]
MKQVGKSLSAFELFWQTPLFPRASWANAGLRNVWCYGTHSFAHVFIPVGMSDGSRR